MGMCVTCTLRRTTSSAICHRPRFVYNFSRVNILVPANAKQSVKTSVGRNVIRASNCIIACREQGWYCTIAITRFIKVVSNKAESSRIVLRSSFCCKEIHFLVEDVANSCVDSAAVFVQHLLVSGLF